MKCNRFKKILIPAVLVPVLLAGCLKQKDEPRIIGGVLDLRNCDLETGPIPLQGEVEFWLNRYVTPEELARGPVEGMHLVKIPEVLNRQRMGEMPIPAEGFGTYHFLIHLNREQVPRERDLGLKLKSINTAFRLYIDGVETARGGRPGMDRDSTVPAYAPQVVHFRPEGETVSILFHVANFHHRRWGILNTLRIGTENTIRARYRRNAYTDLFLLGAIFIIGLYHLFLFFIRKKDRSSLYFALICFAVAARTITTGEKLFLFFFPGASFDLLVRVEYISYFFALPFFAMYVHSLYGEFSRRVAILLSVSSLIFSLIAIMTPLRFYSHSLDVFQVFVFASIVYSLYVFFRLIRARREGALILSAGILFFFATVINDIFHSSQIIRTAFLSPLGLFVFIFSQSFLISLRFSRAFAANEVLTAELNILNRALETKVSERTRELENRNEQLQESGRRITDAHARLQDLDRQKTDFFANISHEIRTPLTLILSPVESLLQGEYRGSVDEEFFRSIQRNALRLLRLINNLLDFSRLDAGRMKISVQRIDIVRMLNNFTLMVRSTLDSRNITLRIEAQSEGMEVYADREKLDTIFMNLLSNAVKFTGREGAIVIRVREEGSFVLIDFSDSGPGIPADMVHLIFDRFGRAPDLTGSAVEGTGIGLALVKELVELHGGTISVMSRHVSEYGSGHGTTFTIALPRDREQIEGREHVEFVSGEDIGVSPLPAGAREMLDFRDETRPGDAHDAVAPRACSTCDHRVLVVDDNADMREFIASILQGQYEVIFAADGREALDLALEARPDIIVSDVMMPRMDGFEMTRMLKVDKELSMIPVILLTARADISDKIEGLEYGADDYVTKPFNPRELLVRVKSLLKLYDYQRLITERNTVIEEDLEAARLLLDRILPGSLPEIDGYDSHVTYLPMDKVGGDLYDIAADESHVRIFIADVSGHGLPGAFLSTVTKMSLEGLGGVREITETLSRINSVIFRSTVRGNFVTAFYCLLDRRSNILTYTSAGHFPCLVYRHETGEFFELYTRGTPLGWFASPKYNQASIQLRKGDRLVLYTDGIIECMSPERELFGMERLMDFLRTRHDRTAGEVSTGLLSLLGDYSGSQSFDDDICLIVFDIR